MATFTPLTPLTPLPPPGLPLFPGFTAHQPETLLLKDGGFWKSKTHVTFASTNQSFLEVVQEKSSLFVVTSASNGAVVMTIEKKKHSFSGKPTEYYGKAPDGRVVWSMRVKMGLLKTTYYLETPTMPGAVSLERKYMGKNIALLHRGQSVMLAETTSGSLSMKRQDRVDVAPGMDLLLAVGIQIVDIEKERDEAKMAASAAS